MPGTGTRSFFLTAQTLHIEAGYWIPVTIREAWSRYYNLGTKILDLWLSAIFTGSKSSHHSAT